MRTHRLKTWPSYWEDMRSGKKKFEVRVNDRDFAVGDRVELDEHDPTWVRLLNREKGPTGRVLLTHILYILHGGQFGLPEKLCVFGICDPVERRRLPTEQLGDPEEP